MQVGKIILINGASSSGKTSIVKAFQAMMPVPYLDAGLDRFLWMLPKRYLNRPLWDEVMGLASKAGPVGNGLVFGMHAALEALSRAGNHVVADHVLIEPAWVDDLIDSFDGLPLYMIGIQCPLEILEQREKARKDRTLGQAKEQFGLVHQCCLYDLEVDTSRLSPEECAGQIRQRVESLKPPQAILKMKERRGHP